ncbi:hypothetical protein [Flavobacterium koreense]
MDLQEKYNVVMASKGEEMMKMLANLTPIEQKYINAKMIVPYLESELKNLDENHPWRNALYIKQQIHDWKEIIKQLESQQHLAQC